MDNGAPDYLCEPLTKLIPKLSANETLGSCFYFLLIMLFLCGDSGELNISPNQRDTQTN